MDALLQLFDTLGIDTVWTNLLIAIIGVISYLVGKKRGNNLRLRK